MLEDDPRWKPKEIEVNSWANLLRQGTFSDMLKEFPIVKNSKIVNIKMYSQRVMASFQSKKFTWHLYPFVDNRAKHLLTSKLCREHTCNTPCVGETIDKLNLSDSYHHERSKFSSSWNHARRDEDKLLSDFDVDIS